MSHARSAIFVLGPLLISCSAVLGIESYPSKPTANARDGAVLDSDVSDVAATPSDAAGDSDARDSSTDSGPFSPSSLPGLVLWLDASRNVQNAPFEWRDRSSSAHVAAVPMGCAAPKLSASGPNGESAITFSKTALQCLRLPDTPALDWAAGDFGLFFVAAWINDPLDAQSNATFGTLYRKDSIDSSSLALFANLPTGPNPPTNFAFLFDNTITPSANSGLNDGVFRIYGASRAGTTVTVLAGPQTVTKPVSASAPAGLAFIGGYPTIDVGRLAGSIVEVVAYKGAVSAADLTALLAYLKTRHVLP